MSKYEDYSESLKWKEVEKKFKLHEASPHIFGKEFRVLIPSSKMNDISGAMVPTSYESKLEYFKKQYWGNCSKHLHPISNLHFLTCCYLGKYIANKCLLVSLLRFVEVGIYEDLPVEVSRFSNDEEIRYLTNKVAELYSPNEVAIEYQRVISRFFTLLPNNLVEPDDLDRWRIRNASIM